MGYPEGMGTSPIRQALRACSEEDAVALLGHALWAQAALADARGDIQEIAWSDTEVSARVRAPGVMYRSVIRYVDSSKTHLHLTCSCYLAGACVHAAALLRRARRECSEDPETQNPAGSVWMSEFESLLSTNGAQAMGLIVDAHDPAQPVWLIPLVLVHNQEARRLSWSELAQSQWSGLLDTLSPHHLMSLRRLYQSSRKSREYSPGSYDVSLESLGRSAPIWLYELQKSGVVLLTPQLHRFDFQMNSFAVAIDMNLGRKGLELCYKREQIDRSGTTLPFPRRADAMGLTFINGGEGAVADPIDDQELAPLNEVCVRIPMSAIGDFIRNQLATLRAHYRCISSMRTFPFDELLPQLRLCLRERNSQYAHVCWAVDYSLEKKRFRSYLPPQTKISHLSDSLARDFDVAHAALRTYFPAASLAPTLHELLIPLPQVPELLRALKNSWPLDSVTWDIDQHLEETRIVDEKVQINAQIQATDSPDWWNLRVTVRVGSEELPISRVLSVLSEDQDYIRLDNGRWLHLEGVDIDRLRLLLRQAAQLHRSRSLDNISLTTSQFGLWENLSEFVDTREEDRQWQTRIDGLRDLAKEEIKAPIEDEPGMRPYQAMGMHWVLNRIRAGFGCVLADDMGLGKTRQILGAIEKFRRHTSHPVLVVVPTSVMSSWRDEAESCFPKMALSLIQSTYARDPQGWNGLDRADVVVTSHMLFRIDCEHWKNRELAGVVIDEAQAAKNPRTQLYRYLKDLPVAWRVCISGTPIENSLEDLWSLMSLAVPGLLSSHSSFNEKFRRPIEAGRSPDFLNLLHSLIAPFVLRRTKEEVAPELPERVETLLPVPLGRKQRQIYDRYLTRERARLLHLELENDTRERFEVLAALTRLRQLSLDPALVDQRYDSVGSAKIDLLCEHLEQILPLGHKVLVFSQFVAFLERIRRSLDQRGIASLLLEGKTRNRHAVIDEFQHGDVQVFLISLKAGGVGLTLTQADYVYMMDPWWNPSVEAQAVNRAHRIGQDRRVNVYRLVAQDTIEEKVCQLQAHKQVLVDSVVGQNLGEGRSSADIQQLLKLIQEDQDGRV